MNCLLFESTWINLPFFDWIRVAHRFSFLTCVCLRPVYPNLLVSLDCPLLIDASDLFNFVLLKEQKLSSFGSFSMMA